LIIILEKEKIIYLFNKVCFMEIEDIILKYLVENKDVGFLFVLLLISLAIGFFGLCYRFFIVQDGDKKWVTLSNIDKSFLALMVGIWSLFVSFISFIVYLVIGLIIHKITGFGLSTTETLANGQINLQALLLVLAFAYPLFAAKFINHKLKDLKFLKALFRKKVINIYFVVCIFVISVLLSLIENNPLQFWGSSLILALTSAVLVIYIKYKRNSKKFEL